MDNISEAFTKVRQELCKAEALLALMVDEPCVHTNKKETMGNFTEKLHNNHPEKKGMDK